MTFFSQIRPYLILVAPLLVINFLTHLVYSYYSGGAYLQVVNPPPYSNNRMVYLIAGNLNQPLTAFRFMADELTDSGVTAVNYLPSGFKPDRIAYQIINDADEHHYRAIVYTISVGDQVGHYIRQICGDTIPVITINPCTTPIFLKPPLRIAMKIVTPVLVVFGWLLGWVSELRWIPACGNHYSLTLLFAQWFQIAYGPQINYLKDQGAAPLGIICSRRDQFLDNDNIEMVYPRATTEYIDSNHANTVGDDHKYLAGIRALHRYIGDVWSHTQPCYFRDDEYARN